MKINLRWAVQAIAFIGCIFFFLKIWNTSKELLSGFAASDLLLIGIYGVLFLVCFFLMGLTKIYTGVGNCLYYIFWFM